MAEIGTKQSPTRVGILAIPGFALMSYASTVEPFRAANLLSRQKLYEVVNIATEGGAIASSGSGHIEADAQIEDRLALDIMFVVAGGNPAAFNDKRVLNWISRLARNGTMIGGVSGGPVILAKAGIMRGRRMTVHWEHAEALIEMSPELLIEKTLYVIDRDRVTCAGGTAPMDLMHALIARDHGAPFARLVSDWFLHTDIRPSAELQRSNLVERIGTVNATVLTAVDAMENHIADPLTLEHLGLVSGISPRQLNRLFQEKLGMSTMKYYRELRLEKAQNLLRNSPLALTEIALATGFANSAHFSTLFKARFGNPPSHSRIGL